MTNHITRGSSWASKPYRCFIHNIISSRQTTNMKGIRIMLELLNTPKVIHKKKHLPPWENG